MKSVLVFFASVFFISLSPFVHAVSLKKTTASSSFPQCVQISKKRFLHYNWDKSKIGRREITAVETNKKCPKTDRPWKQSDFPALGYQWGKFSFDGDRVAFVSDLDKDYRLDVPKDIWPLLAQIHLGANEPRTDKSAREWLSKRPDFVYTRDSNRQLSAEYGAQFSADVYRESVLARLENTQAQNQFEYILREPPSIKGLRQELGETKIVLAWGFPLASEDSSISMRLISRTPGLVTLLSPNLNSIEKNVAAIKKNLKGVLAGSSRVILVGHSIGLLELLLAWRELESEWTERPADSGKVAGIINLAGLNGPMYAAELMEERWWGRAMEIFLKTMSLGPWTWHHWLERLPSLSSESLDLYLKKLDDKSWRDLPTLNVVGLMNQALDGRETGRAYKILEFAQNHSFVDAASDGFVYYPQTEMPSTETARSATIFVPGSHLIFDGFFPEESGAVFRTFVQLWLGIAAHE